MRLPSGENRKSDSSRTLSALSGVSWVCAAKGRMARPMSIRRMNVPLDLKILAEMWGRLATCGRLSIGLSGDAAKPGAFRTGRFSPQSRRYLLLRRDRVDVALFRLGDRGLPLLSRHLAAQLFELAELHPAILFHAEVGKDDRLGVVE